jgi:hypothetical protein
MTRVARMENMKKAYTIFLAKCHTFDLPSRGPRFEFLPGHYSGTWVFICDVPQFL